MVCIRGATEMERAVVASVRQLYPVGRTRGFDSVNPKLTYLLLTTFSIVAAVSAALGCPFFRNPQTYAMAGGAVASLRQLIEVHRKR